MERCDKEFWSWLAGPARELKGWDKRKEWIFDELAEDKEWKPSNGAELSFADGGLRIGGKAKSGDLSLGDFYHAGPFLAVRFDQKVGPEGLDAFDTDKKFKHEEKEIAWVHKPEWKNGQLYGQVFVAESAVNYLHKVITTDAPRDLPLSLGSDDGIKVFLNGKQIHANNVGRGAAPDQEKITVKLRKGVNNLLLKIHNQAGPSGFYFRGDVVAKALPAVAAKAESPKGSISVEGVAKASDSRKAKVFWKTKKENNFSDKRSTASVDVAKGGDWKTYRFDFVTTDDLTGLQFQPGGELAVKSFKLYRNEVPVKLAFRNALATFSQKGYAVASAIEDIIDRTRCVTVCRGVLVGAQ